MPSAYPGQCSAVVDMQARHRLPARWPHRLTVRTPGSHPGNWSSILHEVTKKNTLVKARVFFLAWLLREANSASKASKFEDKRHAQKLVSSMVRRRIDVVNILHEVTGLLKY